MEEKLGDYVRRLRLERGLTQKQLAERIVPHPLSDPYINQIELNNKLPSLETAKGIAEALGVDPSHMIMRCLEARLGADIKQHIVVSPPRDSTASTLYRTGRQLTEEEQEVLEAMADEEIRRSLVRQARIEKLAKRAIRPKKL